MRGFSESHVNDVTSDKPAQSFSAAMASLSTTSEEFVPALADLILRSARQHRASDVHLIPTEDRLLMRWRIDGVLQHVAAFDGSLTQRLVARLKVMSGLLTYRTDVPQEGRIAAEFMTKLTSPSPAEAHHSRPAPTRRAKNKLVDSAEAAAVPVGITGEVRVTTFPTLFGEKAAIRLFADVGRFQRLNDLELPADVEAELIELLHRTSGVILLTGPSGSGKTTTAYACLREIVRRFGDERSVMTLEDPIEMVVSGVTQSQIRPHVGFDLPTGLKSMMRQDPDVIMIGE
ncbi:MAG: Flp pilus assembly complex ATPase component TadA, partial [Planctomycetaceae bacterium]|nr:Flp pilus assembly complex ATPase component TadA [Planctomycetaceae bacterium]